MYSVKAGKYRQRISIEEKVTTQDPDNGEETHTWQPVVLDSDITLDSIPAEVLMGPGRESFAAAAKQASITARINFRWFEGLTQEMRIVWDGRIYNIEGIEADSTGRLEWRCQCTAGLTDGE